MTKVFSAPSLTDLVDVIHNAQGVPQPDTADVAAYIRATTNICGVQAIAILQISKSVAVYHRNRDEKVIILSASPKTEFHGRRLAVGNRR